MKKTTVAKALLILGGILGLVPLFLFISLPIYLVGAFLIIKSDYSKKSKIIWIVVPLVIIVLVWSVIMLLNN